MVSLKQTGILYLKIIGCQGIFFNPLLNFFTKITPITFHWASNGLQLVKRVVEFNVYMISVWGFWENNNSLPSLWQADYLTRANLAYRKDIIQFFLVYNVSSGNNFSAFSSCRQHTVYPISGMRINKHCVLISHK